ncbi:putative IQ motif, EF-hand binding, ankyrin repeat-containing domain-containing protein [Plasmopara halstedii]
MELRGRRRHDQQRLLVELEQNDSLYPWEKADESKRINSTRNANRSRPLNPSYGNHVSTVSTPPYQPRGFRDTATKPHAERRTQQLDVKRLSSKQSKKDVFGINRDSKLPRYQQHCAQQAARLSLAQPSAAQVMIKAIRQNIDLRDQVMARLHQGLMGELPLHRVPRLEDNLPRLGDNFPRQIITLLNRMRSLSLSLVEAVVYLSSELSNFDADTSDYVHDTLHKEFYPYLLQMASCNTKSLTCCSPQLQQLFVDFQASLTRNPFLDGLSLDSSEILLCSCHQSMSSSGLFCSASSLTSSRLRSLTQKLAFFALQTQRYLPSWQNLPAERVVAALLHLLDVEAYLTANPILPGYLNSHNSHGDYLHRSTQMEYGHDDGVLENESIQRRYSHVLHEEGDQFASGIPVINAWAGSPTAKMSGPSEYSPSKLRESMKQSSWREDDSNQLNKKDVMSSAIRLPFPTQFNISDNTGKHEDIKLFDEGERKSSLVNQALLSKRTIYATQENETDRSFSSAWIQQSPGPNFDRKDSLRNGFATFTSTETSTDSLDLNQTRVVLPLPSLDLNTSAKVTLDRSGIQKNLSRKKTGNIDAGTKMSRASSLDEDKMERSKSITEYDEFCRARERIDEETKLSVLVNRHAFSPEVRPATKTFRSIKALDSIEPTDASAGESNAALSVNYGTATDYEDGCGCDFEYSSDAALSGIAMVLQMLPDFSLFTSTPLPVVEEVEFKNDVRNIEGENGMLCTANEQKLVLIDSAVMDSAYTPPLIANVDPIPTSRTLAPIVNGGILGNCVYELEDVEQKADLLKSDIDEFAYTSESAISNIAMALSLLPSVLNHQVCSVSAKEADIQSRIDSFKNTTYQSIDTRPMQLQQTPRVDEAANVSIEYNAQKYSFSPSLRSIGGKNSGTSFCSETSAVDDSVAAKTSPAPSYSANFAALSCVDAEASDLKRIFALCQDIQVTALDMSRWISQQEFEDNMRSLARPFLSVTSYSSPCRPCSDDAVRFLESELKMLRRNLICWKKWIVDHQSAKSTVRRVVATRKVQTFVLLHHIRHVQNQAEKENNLRSNLASRIQRNWRINRYNRDVSNRKVAFCAVNLAFRRVVFFVGISRRRRQREHCKEIVVRWWRHERSRIKKKKLRREKAVRDQDRRARAERNIYNFLKEVLLRRKLIATQELANKRFFEKKRKWNNAKRQMKKKLKLDGKHRIDLIADLDAQFADLARKYKQSEYERQALLTHHERFVCQQQQAVEIRRRRLAALKIQMFFRVSVFHEKLLRVEAQRKKYVVELQKEHLTKARRNFQIQKQHTTTRTQVRVLKRKIDRMTQNAIYTDTQHNHVVQNYREQERITREHVARQKVKGFLVYRMVVRRANRECQMLLRDQAQLRAEVAEIDVMLCKDQREQQRAAFLIVSELKQRLLEIEVRLEILQTQLAAEKEEAARQATKAPEHSKLQAFMHQILSWGATHLQLTELRKEIDAVRVLAAVEMAEEKKKQREEIDAKIREITSIKATSVIQRYTGQKRTFKTAEMMRTQLEHETLKQQAIAERSRAQVVQLILDVKLLTERETISGITQGLHGMMQVCKMQAHKFFTLKQLQNDHFARIIQRVWRRRQHKHKWQETALVSINENKRKQNFVHKIQVGWLKSFQVRRRRRDQQLVFDAHLDKTCIQTHVRKIQCTWQCRAQRKGEQRRISIQNPEFIYQETSVRKIQKIWKQYYQYGLARRHVKRLAHDALIKLICLHANARKIQRTLRRWAQSELKQSQQQQPAREERTELIIYRFSLSEIQQRWGCWMDITKKHEERHVAHHCVYINVVRLQRWWRRVRQNSRAKATKDRIVRNACAQVIKKKWRHWHRMRVAQCEARRQYEMENLETISSKRIQNVWRRWHKMNVERKQKVNNEYIFATMLQQKSSEEFALRNREGVERKQSIQELRVQKSGLRRHLAEEARRSKQRAIENWRVSSALLLQRKWKIAHHKRIQEEQIANENEEQLRQRSAINIQTFWRKKQVQMKVQLRIERLKDLHDTRLVANQRNWSSRHYGNEMERQKIQHRQVTAVLVIQTMWLKWHRVLKKGIERGLFRMERDKISIQIQRNWEVSQQRRKMVREHPRNRENFNALIIQKNWRWLRYRYFERPSKINNMASQKVRSGVEAELKAVQDDQSYHVKLSIKEVLGQRIVRAAKRYLKNQREIKAATKIKTVWKKKVCRSQYMQLLEEKHAEEARQYQLKLSVVAAKVQACWQQWHGGLRHAKRAAVKNEELHLIHEAKALERKLAAAKRTLAAKRIQRSLASRKRLTVSKGVSSSEIAGNFDPSKDKEDIEALKEPVFELTEGTVDQSQMECESDDEALNVLKKDIARTTITWIVEDWSHRHLPHILSRSVNQIYFCHEAAIVLQKCFRSYQRRQQLQIYFQHECVCSLQNSDTKADSVYLHFYLKQARAWLAWDVPQSSSAVFCNGGHFALLRLRFDSQLTRKLLQMFEPNNHYPTSKILEVLRAIAIDAVPIFQSPVCLEDNDNPKQGLRYHVVGELELPQFVLQLQQMEHDFVRNQHLMNIAIDSKLSSLSSSNSKLMTLMAPSPSSQSAKEKVTIFDVIKIASVEDALCLQQNGVDMWTLEVKTQRNALHLLSFSKGSDSSRLKLLDFLLNCAGLINVNALDCNGDTPLMLYASHGHLGLMQKLLRNGANVHVTNKSGQNLLHQACENDQVEICGFLHQLMLKDSIAANLPTANTISLSVLTAQSLHTPDKTGRFPLHYLVEKGFVECAKQLMVHIEAHRDWNRMLQAQRNSDGRTALHLAVRTHNVAMTAHLLTIDGDTDVNTYDYLHRSPLHYAVESPAALSQISHLIQRGAIVNVADERGDTPLHWAAFSGRLAVTQKLLSLGADSTLTNSDWETPAQIAAAFGQLDCMQLILRAQQELSADTASDQMLQQIKLSPNDDFGLLEVEEPASNLYRQASTRSSAYNDDDAAAKKKFSADQAYERYWEELHQDVQLVEESGQFSSDDELESSSIA